MVLRKRKATRSALSFYDRRQRVVPKQKAGGFSQKDGSFVDQNTRTGKRGLAEAFKADLRDGKAIG